MIKGAVSLVTGGASGLGKATVERLVKEGSKVVFCDVPSSKGTEVAKGFDEETVLYVPANVTSEEDINNVLMATKKKFKKLNNVINCAGISIPMKTYNFKTKKEHNLEHFTNTMMVNTVGTFNVIRLAVGLMGENEIDEHGCRGVVVNTASVLAFDGQIGFTAYSASKGAVVGMTLPLARDLSSQGIRVVTVAPGMFMTPILHGVRQELLDHIADITPCPKRWGMPMEFAQLVQSIIENPMLNGEIIRLDGALRLPL